jgi:hypothetical protein
MRPHEWGTRPADADGWVGDGARGIKKQEREAAIARNHPEFLMQMELDRHSYAD